MWLQFGSRSLTDIVNITSGGGIESIRSVHAISLATTAIRIFLSLEPGSLQVSYRIVAASQIALDDQPYLNSKQTYVVTAQPSDIQVRFRDFRKPCRSTFNKGGVSPKRKADTAVYG